jgi:hypothetical protein
MSFFAYLKGMSHANFPSAASGFSWTRRVCRRSRAPEPPTGRHRGDTSARADDDLCCTSAAPYQHNDRPHALTCG